MVGTVLRGTLRVAGELLVTLGLVVLLFAAYEVYGKTAAINDHQNALDHRFDQAPLVPPAGAGPAALPPPPGNAIGRLYLPRLDLHWVVVEGVSLPDIRYAPGHYPGTAMPGQRGNFAVAGHRVIGMFWDLDQLRPGDVAIVETQTDWYVYQVSRSEVVTPHSVEVIAARPDQPGAPPDGAYLTLTTCNPKYNNYQRLVVHGRLVERRPHDQRPAELGS